MSRHTRYTFRAPRGKTWHAHGDVEGLMTFMTLAVWWVLYWVTFSVVFTCKAACGLATRSKERNSST